DGVLPGKRRLNWAKNGLAGGRLAHLADRIIAGKPIDDVASREGIAHQSQPAFGVKPLAVEADYAGGLLAAVLQGVQTKGRNRRRVEMSEYAEYAAFLAEPIRVEVEGGRSGHDLGASTRSSPLRR